VKIDGKVVTQPASGVVKNIKAINSLGATTNSIAIMVEDLNKNFGAFMSKNMALSEQMLNMREDNLEDEKKYRKKQLEAAKREKGKEQDKRAEALQEGKKKKGSGLGKAAKETAARSIGFLAGLASLFKGIFRSMIMYNLLDWLEKNPKKIKRLLDAMVGIGKFIMNTYGTLINLGLNGLVDFLENPLSFKGIFGLLKVVTALGLLFAPVAMGKLGLKLVFSLFKGGKLIPALKGIFGAVGSMVKGLIGLVKGMGMWAWVLAGGIGLFTLGAAFNGQQSQTDETIDAKVEETSQQEVIDSLQKQLEGLNAWDKIWGKEGEIKNQLDRLKDENYTPGETKPTETNNPKPPPKKKFFGLFSKGGKLPGYAEGGWIHGPQSGYPVSLSGGGVDFIGHGTEFVATRASGGDAFVIPFDTPATRGSNGLTSMRMQQAKAGGYNVPGFAKGGPTKKKRDGSMSENRLIGADQLMAKGGKIFLHWTAGGPHFTQKGKYHSIIQGSGKVFRAHPYDQKSGVAHTYLRNSQGIGMSVAAMAGSGGNYVWPTSGQIDSMAKEIANVGKQWGWNPNDINIKNVMTHAEAASGKDGQLPRNDNYGPTAWGGDGARWDLWHLTKDGAKGSGGNILRAKARGYMGGDSTVIEETGSAPIQSTTGATQAANGSAGNTSAAAESSGLDPTKKYLGQAGMVEFFSKSLGILGNYASDAKPMTGGSGADSKTLTATPFRTDLNLGVSKAADFKTSNIDFSAKSGVDFNTAMNTDLKLFGVGGAFSPWRRKYAAGGKVPYDKVKSALGADQKTWDIFRGTIAEIESGGKYNIAGGSRNHYDGKYQMGADAKTDGARNIGLPDPGHGAAQRASYRNNPDLQEQIFAGYTIANHKLLMAKSPQYKKKSLLQKLQTLGYAHNQGWGGAADWLATGNVGADGFGTKGTKYTDALRAAFTSGKIPDLAAADSNGSSLASDSQSSDGSGGGDAAKDPMQQLQDNIGLLDKYVADAAVMTGAKINTSGDRLAEAQNKEDEEKANADKDTQTLTSSTAAPVGATKQTPGDVQPQVDLPAVAYDIPANIYARPRFGLTADIFQQPVNIA